MDCNLMQNHWLRKRFWGVIRYTNMVMQTDEYNLPTQFTIESVVNGMYRCNKNNIPGPGPYLTWLSRDVIEVNGQKYKLKYSPACSVPIGDYVFLTV